MKMTLLRMAACALVGCGVAGAPRISPAAEPEEPALTSRLGQSADISGSAYRYRADRPDDANPPESWILLMQYAGLPYDQPVDVKAPAIRRALCGLLWDEVRPVRRIELVWPADAKRQPTPGQITLTYFDGTDHTAHTWWNPRALKDADPPQVSSDGRTYRYAIPVDTWGVVASLREPGEASGFAVPEVRALTPEVWKKMDLEIEWGFDNSTAALNYDGRIEAYDGVLATVRPLADDTGTIITGSHAWRSARHSGGRRGVQMSVLYIGTSRWRRVWPYHAQPEDVARTILTVWTTNGSFSFLVSDLEQGPILASEYGYFVRSTGRQESPSGPAAPTNPPVPARQTLAGKFNVLPGVPKMRGWADHGIPWFGVNPETLSGTTGRLQIPARSVAMHPVPDRDVAAGWRSPIQGHVSITGKVSMADPAGGNGIEWFVLHDEKKGRHVLSRGTVATGGAQAMPTSADRSKLTGIAVETEDYLTLVVGAKEGNHVCDTTLIDFVIREIGGRGRVWNLANDVLDSLHADNPHADSLGNAGVWHFHTTSAPQTPPPPAPSEPPFSLASNAGTAKEFVNELSAAARRGIRQRVRQHPEQTWDQAVAAMHPGVVLRPHPQPAFEPPMQVEVPDERLTAQWKLGAWHILRQRQFLAANLPGGSNLWSKGLQPAHVVTPDSERMHMQFYESEAYY